MNSTSTKERMLFVEAESLKETDPKEVEVSHDLCEEVE
jgi:hypothetical protein